MKKIAQCVDPEIQILPSRPPARARRLQTVVARAYHLQSDNHMHCFPNCNCIACVLAERSRSTPQALGNPLKMAALAR
eukprot:6196949-Pleurochrysis_carterae.AAC.1